MSMMEAVKSAFSKYATFKGRARRSEYWYFFFFNSVIVLLLKIIMRIFATKDGITLYSLVSEGGSVRYNIVNLIYELYLLATLLPSLAAGCRRMHDVGKSGACILIPIASFIWSIRDSDPSENQYGFNPKKSPIINRIPPDSVICPSCSGKNKPGTSFCVHCGKPMHPVTPAEEKKFCVNCGAQVDKYIRICPCCSKNSDIKESVSGKMDRYDNPWERI